MSIVSVVKAETYDPALMAEAVSRHFAALDVEKDMRPGLKVLIKPNLIGAHKPEDAATTHPQLISAIVDWLMAHGVTDITVADSPGGPYLPALLKNIYNTAGLRILEGRAKLNEDIGWQTIYTAEGMTHRTFNIINPICEAEYIINAAKLKTHGMTTMTAGIKNMFGSIPGIQKPEMHYRNSDYDGFTNMLLELASTVTPNVTIIDAVDGMEGNGPTGGTPRHMGVTLASRDVFSQDWHAAYLMGLDPESVPILRQARDKGLAKPDEIELVGDNAEPVDPPFVVPDSRNFDFTDNVPAPFKKIVGKILPAILKAVPKLDESKCIGCGKCAQTCPPKIITIQNRKAVIPRKGCISCFCCQEMCPEHAIDTKRIIRF